MTFTADDILEKPEDGSRQTRCVPRLGPKCELVQILGEIVSSEPGRSPKQARTVLKQSRDLSP